MVKIIFFIVSMNKLLKTVELPMSLRRYDAHVGLILKIESGAVMFFFLSRHFFFIDEHSRPEDTVCDLYHGISQASNPTNVPYINSLRPSDAYTCRWTGSSLVQIMTCRLFGAKPLSEPMLE